MPFIREKYCEDWEELSRYIRFDRAGGHCEGSPGYPDCRVENGRPHPVTGAIVVLTVGHLDHDTENNDPANLRAWCQKCHLTHDAKYHALHAAMTRRQSRIEAGQLVLLKETNTNVKGG